MTVLHVSAAGVLLLLAVGASGSPAPTLFPEKIAGRRATGGETFGRSDLFDFIDGGAEVYLAYGFRRVWVRFYRAEGRPEIAAEAYDMGRGEEAYGVLSVDPTGEHVEVGSVARYGAGLLRFCKGRWFIRLLAERETAETRKAVLALGREMAGAIEEESAPPELISMLPPDGLLPDTTTYFHTQVTLNQLYYLAQENLLGLGPEVEAAIADYRVGTGEAKLLIVRYPSAGGCLEAREAFVGAYLNVEGAGDGTLVERVEGQRSVGVAAAPPYLVLVLDGSDDGAVSGLIDRIVTAVRGGKQDE